MTEFIHRRFRYCRKHGQYRTWVTQSLFYSMIEARTLCDLKQSSLQQVYQIVPALREKLRLKSVFLYIIKRFELSRTFTGHCCKSGLSAAVSVPIETTNIVELCIFDLGRLRIEKNPYFEAVRHKS